MKNLSNFTKRLAMFKGKLLICTNLARIYANQGEVAKAIAFYEESLELTEKIGNVQGKAATLHQLAGIYANQGEVAKAIAFYEQSLELNGKDWRCSSGKLLLCTN